MATRGRKPGVRSGPHAGSNAHALLQMAVGDRRYIETTIDRWAHDMRQTAVPRTRRPPGLDGWEFESRLFTAVSSSTAGDIRYLICIERTA